MLPVAPLPFDDFGRAQIEGVRISIKVFEKPVHLWAFYSGFAASWLLYVTSMRIKLRDHKRTTEPDDGNTIVSVRVLAFISHHNAQADPGGRVV